MPGGRCGGSPSGDSRSSTPASNPGPSASRKAPNLWVAPASSQGLRRIVPTYLPKELAERPGTSLAFEFLDQRFELNLDVEASPPLVRSRSRTLFHIGADRARSETTIELQWVRGRLFEVPLRLGMGLEVVSVGPASVVEAWNPTGGPPARGASGSAAEPRGLTIRLASAVRDQSNVALRLEGFQRLPREGPVSLGLFAPDETTAVSTSIAVAGDRGLAVELDPDATRSDDAAFKIMDAAAPLPPYFSGGEASRPALTVDAAGSPRALPIRITRHARSVHQDTLLAAGISRDRVDLNQRTTFTVRHGTLGALEIRVPPALVDGWELIDREVVDQEELAREPDGSRVYRLFLDRPVVDRATLGFRCRLAIRPHLDAAGDRELAIPWITFPQAVPGPTRVELTPAPGIVLRGGDPSWVRAAPAGQGESGGEAAGLSYVEGSAGKGRPFQFRAVALEPVGLARPAGPSTAHQVHHGFRPCGPPPGVVLGRDPQDGLSVRPAGGRPVHRRAGRGPGRRPGRFRARAGRLPAPFPGRHGRAPDRGRAGVSARRHGRRLAMAGAPTPGGRHRAPDALGGATAMGSGPAGRPARLVRRE